MTSTAQWDEIVPVIVLQVINQEGLPQGNDVVEV
jgi:hypothetical protein